MAVLYTYPGIFRLGSFAKPFRANTESGVGQIDETSDTPPTAKLTVHGYFKSPLLNDSKKFSPEICSIDNFLTFIRYKTNITIID